ncbi:MAG: homocysteine S-methyltransferase family protein [Planctomycetes bacterium]|nr:homocysteine S-methyltransferase family protein [Planctomycetota bacterium]
MGRQALPIQRGPVVLDGAMGSMLLAAGVFQADRLHRACLENPVAVDEVHRGHAESGASVATTNTFLVAGEREPLASEIMARAISLARGHGGVWASVGPASPAPKSPPAWWARLGEADAILFETWSGSDLLPWLSFPRPRPIILNFCLGKCGTRTLGGWTISEVAGLAHEHAAAAVGFNCGWEGHAEDHPRAVGLLRRATTLPIVARPASCGLDPDEWAKMALRCVEAGATHIGGCCGATPGHIKSLFDLIGPRRATHGLS